MQAITKTEAEVRSWLEQHWTPEITLGEWWDRLADAGYAFPTWPSAFGGRGVSSAEARTVTATLASAGLIGPPVGNATTMGVPTVLEHGTATQKDRFVIPAVHGREAWAQLFSEPGAGSDLASLSTRAELDGDEYVVNGQKVWSTGADGSDWGMLLARTDFDLPKHRGITFMMIEMDQPGVVVRPLVQMNGSAEFCEVFLTDARVPTANVIGGDGNGWTVSQTTLAHERAGIGGGGRARGLLSVAPGRRAGNLGQRVRDIMAAAAALDRSRTRRAEVLLNTRTMVELAREAGRTDDAHLRDRLMRFHTDSQVYKWTGQRSRDNALSGRPGPEGSILKLQLAMLAHHSRDLSLSILGPHGLLSGSDAPGSGRFAMAALSSFAPSLGGGTNEIQRNIIGERALGLPREPAIDPATPFRELRRS